jgi:hypothetical protein
MLCEPRSSRFIDPYQLIARRRATLRFQASWTLGDRQGDFFEGYSVIQCTVLELK